jgi:hypothetical protein
MPRVGQRLSAESRRNISAAKIEFYRQQYLQRDPALEPTHKCCNKCGEYRPVEDFYAIKAKLKSGLTSVRASPRCKRCTQEDHRERRTRQEAEGIDVRAKDRERRRRYLERHGEKRRQYEREWRRARRLAEGKVPGTWRKYSNVETREEVAVEPIAVFLEERLERESKSEIEAVTGIDKRRLYSIENRETESVLLSTVDAILTGLDCSEELNVLYPPEPEKLVGYHVLDENGKPLH